MVTSAESESQARKRARLAGVYSTPWRARYESTRQVPRERKLADMIDEFVRQLE